MAAALERIVLLAGGVGGARMAEGLARALPPGALTVIANVGDDAEFYGLHVAPDIDTLIYTLSNRIDRSQGWGVSDDTIRALDVIRDLGAPVWMKLGDADFGLHIWRTWRLSQGATMTEVTEEAARRLGASARILPATDDPVRTELLTDDGWMDFQPWFVGRHCKPVVSEIRYEGAATARASAAALAAIAAADVILFAPSNPFLSIEPILAIDGVRQALDRSLAPRVGISPLIGGKAVKGPLARLMADFGIEPSVAAVCDRYAGCLDGFMIDKQDDAEAVNLHQRGMAVQTGDILMRDPADAERLAREVLAFAGAVVRRQDGQAA